MSFIKMEEDILKLMITTKNHRNKILTVNNSNITKFYNMCGVKFIGDSGSNKTSEGHQKLKELRKHRQPDLDDSFDLHNFIEDLNDENEICFKINGRRELVDEEEVCAVQEIRFLSYNPHVALGNY